MAPVHARVVWAREGRAYVAALDTIAGASLPIGARIEFVARRKTVASGEVSGVLDGEVVVATLTSGSLAGQKHLDRIQVLAEPPTLRALRSLRVGFPSRRRSTLLFACGAMKLRPPLSPGVYRVDTLAESSYRWVSPSAEPGSTTLPDTIYAHQFEDAADEEIALERGELDVAVFWPGEPSRHIRDHAGVQNSTWAKRDRGVVAAIVLDSRSPVDTSGIGLETPALSRLNQDLFRGDLGPPPWSKPIVMEVRQGALTDPVRFEVDSSCPGRKALESQLNREMDRRGYNSPHVIRLFYMDVPSYSVSAVTISILEYARRQDPQTPRKPAADSLKHLDEIENHELLGRPASEIWSRWARNSRLRPTLLFTIRCPVLGTPELRDRLPALGRELVDLMDCDSKASSP